MENKVGKIMGAVALLLALVPWTGQAQQVQADHSQHSVPLSELDPTAIEGSATPEQIPDAVIFRIWSLHNTRNGKIQDLEGYGLTPEALSEITNTMKSFRASFDAIENMQPGNAGDDSKFWTPVIKLTNTTFETLQTHLSDKDLKLFLAHLQTRKSGLRLSNIDYGLSSQVRDHNLRERSMVASAHPMAPNGDGMTANYSSYTQWNASGGEQIDTFGTTEEGSLNSSNWVSTFGSFQVNTAGYVYQVTGGGTGGIWAWAYRKSAASFANGCASTRAGTLDSNNSFVMPAIRISPTTQTGYYAYFHGNTVMLGDAVNGTYTNLTSASYTGHVGDVLTICANGSTIKVVVNGKAYISVTNSSIQGAGYSGMISNTTIGGQGLAWKGHTALGIQLSANISGTTTCSGGECPIGAFHYGTLSLSSSAGGTSTQGSRVLPQNYLYDSIEYTYYDDGGDPTGETGVTIQGQVTCTIIGTFWQFIPPSAFLDFWESEIAQTTAANLAPVPGKPGTYYVANHCNAASSPPDLNVDDAWQQGEPANDPAWDDMMECNRVKFFGTYTAWGCPIPGVPAVTVALPVYSYVTLPDLQPCTVWTKGQINPPGWPLVGTPPN